jgi:transposase
MTQQTRTTLGIDISKRHFDVALNTLNGKSKHKKFTNDEEGFKGLLAWLKPFDVNDLHACMEATNVYGDALAEFLFDKNYDVSVVNPARVKGFSRSEMLRTKNDKQDASLIARFCYAMSPTLWQPKPTNIKHLKAMAKRLDTLIEMRQQEVNRLDVADPVVQPDIECHISDIETLITDMKLRIEAHIDKDPDLNRKKELLLSIPGVGEKTISTLLSYFSDVEQFDNAKKLASFCGVAPREFQSGSSVKGRGGMSKVGSAHVRKALFMPAMTALRFNPLIISMKERLSSQGKPKMVIIGAAMRKLIHIIYGVLKNNTPFNENIAV